MKSKKFLRTFIILISLIYFIFHQKVLFGENLENEKDIFPILQINGELRNETAFRVSKPNEFTKIKNLLSIEGRYELTPNIKLTVSGRGFYDAVFSIEDNFPENVRKDQETELTLRNAYIDFSYKNLDLRIGKQQIVWGEATTFIADIVNPKDLREFLLPDFEYIRIPIWAVDINYWIQQGFSVEVVWTPDLEFNKLPAKGSEFELFDPLEYSGLRVVSESTKKPPETFKNSEIGMKANFFINGWDFSFFYLYAFDDFPIRRNRILIDTSTGQPYILVSPEYTRLHNFGLTFSKTVKSVVIKGELTMPLGKYFLTKDINDADRVTQRASVDYMLGFNYNLFSDINLDFQIIQQIIEGPSTLYEDLVKTYLSLTLHKISLTDKLIPELLFIIGAEHKDYQFSPKFSYRITDAINVTIGADIFGGPKDTFYGQYHDKDRFTLTIRYVF